LDHDVRRTTRPQTAGGLERFSCLTAAAVYPNHLQYVQGAKRLGEIARFGFPASGRPHFDWFEKFPLGLLAFGDAMCCFDPVYDQGLGLTAQGACLLHELLCRRAEETRPRARSPLFGRS